VVRKRSEVRQMLVQKNSIPRFFNGGGTGSIHTSGQESWLTEIAVGSGFLQSHLFDYYALNQCVPAMAFALQICRIPQAGLATCKSGGFIASGETGKDKMPLPFLPEGMKITANEGFGEVQTPIVLSQGFETSLGAPLFFRPAKSGEIAEHFTHYYLIRNHKIVDKIPTYRGLGLSFY